MNTLSEVIDALRKKNVDTEFVWAANTLNANDKSYAAQSLQIVKTYRFEGASDPDDSAILYIIKTSDGLIGYSIDAYGANLNYDENYENFIRQIPILGHNDQMEFIL